MPFQYLNIRERAEAFRRAGVDWADDFLSALDDADDFLSALDDADAALENIGEAIDLTFSDTGDREGIAEAVKNYCSNLEKERRGVEVEVERLKKAVARLQEEQGRLVAFMAARGIVPPPPPTVTRPATPSARGSFGPTLRQQQRLADITDEDVPF